MKTLTPEEFKKKYGEESLGAFKQTSVPTTFGSRIAESLKGSLSTAKSQIQGTGEFSKQIAPQRGVELAATITGAPVKAVGASLPQGVKDVAGAVVKPIGMALNWLSDKISDSKALQDFTMQYPEATQALENIAKTSGALSETAGNLILEKGAVDLGKSAVKGTINLAKKGTEGVLSKTEKIVNATPEKIMQRVARISKDKQAKFEQVAGESVGKYLTKRGIFGNVEDITSKLYTRFRNSVQTADDALAKLQGRFSPTPVKTALNDLLKRELEVSTPGAPSKILGRVQQLSKQKSWTMSEINEIKRLFEANVKVDYLKTMNPKGVAQATNLDSAIRKWQFKQADILGLKNLPAINRETQLARSLMDALGKEYAGSAGNNAMTLTDWIMLSGGDPTAVGGFLIKKGFSSKSVQAAIAKVLNKGRGIGEVGADLQPTSILNLPVGSGAVRSFVGSSKTIKVPPKGSNIDVIR